jgi:hypothetical protein
MNFRRGTLSHYIAKGGLYQERPDSASCPFFARRGIMPASAAAPFQFSAETCQRKTPGKVEDRKMC